MQEGILPEVDEAFTKSFGVESGDIEELRGEVRNNLERELGTVVRKAATKIAEYEEPPMDEALKQELREFVSRRRTELGD